MPRTSVHMPSRLARSGRADGLTQTSSTSHKPTTTRWSRVRVSFPSHHNLLENTKTYSTAAVSGRLITPKRSAWSPGELDSLDDTHLFFSKSRLPRNSHSPFQKVPSAPFQVPSANKFLVSWKQFRFSVMFGSGLWVGAVPPVGPLLVWASLTSGRV